MTTRPNDKVDIEQMRCGWQDAAMVCWLVLSLSSSPPVCSTLPISRCFGGIPSEVRIASWKRLILNVTMYHEKMSYRRDKPSPSKR